MICYYTNYTQESRKYAKGFKAHWAGLVWRAPFCSKYIYWVKADFQRGISHEKAQILPRMPQPNARVLLCVWLWACLCFVFFG